MSKDKVIDSLTGIDDDMIETVAALRSKSSCHLDTESGGAACYYRYVTCKIEIIAHWDLPP
jgi:hypothetical protein